MTFDLVLRGGHVIDPANAIDAVMDVAIAGDRIVRVAPSIPESEHPDAIVGFKTAHYWTRDAWDAAHAPWAWVDAARLEGQGGLACDMTLRRGRIVWDPGGMGMPDWQDAPAPYWSVPSLQGH